MRDVLDTVGRTPLVRLKTPPGHAEIRAKLEFANPGRSVKDRIARAMVLDARRSGALGPGGGVIEATSGNTGIGLAVVCAALGHPLTLVLPESMTSERLTVARALGARVVTTDADAGMAGAMEEAERLSELDGAFLTRQFTNPANPLVHEETTGPEILDALAGRRIDALVAGVGTGGTITGVGRLLRSAHPEMRIIAVEPSGSPVLSGGEPGPHRIQGIGAGFVPPLLDRALLDAVATVDDLDAWEESRRLAVGEGLFVGVSAGAAVVAARREAEALGEGSIVVTVLPDSGERYLSVEHYFAA